MVVEFDPEKSRRNAVERGLPFALVDALDWTTAVLVEDARKSYGELRLIVIGLIAGRLHVAIVTPRGEDLRVISLRRANKKDVMIYEQEIGRSGRTRG